MVRIELEPESALIDREIVVRIVGLEPSQTVDLTGTMRENHGQRWESRATFQANHDGLADLTADRPVQGTYDGVDPMGLFWSMTKKTEERESFTEAKGELSPVVIRLTAEADGQEIASTSFERLFVAPEVKRREVRENGLVGTFFEPPVEGKAPGIVVLGGSAGGLHESRAALLASHGFATLALAYFGVDGLPDTLSQIPLEYFETALHWLNDRQAVSDGRLGVIGISRGGELALLLGSRFSSIRAVAALVPSAIVHSGFPDKGPAWTHRGSAIPYVPSDTDRWMDTHHDDSPPIYLTPVFLKNTLFDALSRPELVSSAIIPVERINGPVLFVSGDDDQMWPSSVMAEISMARLKGNDHPFSFEHLCCEGAGHLLGSPHLPTTVNRVTHPVDGKVYELGGSPKKNAAANRSSWEKILEFFGSALKTRNPT